MIADEEIKLAVEAVMVKVQNCTPSIIELSALRKVVEAVFTVIVDLPVGSKQPEPAPELQVLTEPHRPGYWWVWDQGRWIPAFVSQREFTAQIGLRAYQHWMEMIAPKVVP